MTGSSPALLHDDRVFEIGAPRWFTRLSIVFLPFALLAGAFAMTWALGWIGAIAAGVLSTYVLIKWSPTRKRWNLTEQGVDFDKTYHGRIGWASINRIKLSHARVQFDYI